MIDAEIIAALAIGFGAGVVSGLFGVGGGIVFVPALALVLGLGQAEAEATSLLAIVPVAMVGAWRQHGYGNLRIREGLVIGALSFPGALAAAAIATSLGDDALRYSFAGLCVFVSFRMIRHGLSSGKPAAESPD